MRRSTWRKQHKWIGIGISLFLMMFAVTGILLNHRNAIKNISISRKWLPERYAYRNWNSGLLRGSLSVGVDNVLIYGNNGIWLTDKDHSFFRDFNDGLPCNADDRQIRRLVITRDGDLFAVTPFSLYRYGEHDIWHNVKVPKDDELLTDIEVRGDSIVVISRDRLWLALPPYNHFQVIKLTAPDDADGKVSFFNFVWLLHSGALFGFAGRIIADTIALLIILLCVTGITYWLTKRCKAKVFLIHNKVGRYTIVLTILIALTGWSLRPPMMILLAKTRIHAIPGTTQSSDNAWHDKLRMIRYDKAFNDWLISTTDGIYSFKELSKKDWAHHKDDVYDFKPTKIKTAPPTNVMGFTVMQKDSKGHWLCGSMGGMLVWSRQAGQVTDYFTGKSPVINKKSPIGQHAISGYSNDFRKPVVVDYMNGTKFAKQPEGLDYLPMSLWNVALEIHSGRIYAGNLGSFLFIFIAGLLVIWCLWSGYKLRK